MHVTRSNNFLLKFYSLTNAGNLLINFYCRVTFLNCNKSSRTIDKLKCMHYQHVRNFLTRWCLEYEIAKREKPKRRCLKGVLKFRYTERIAVYCIVWLQRFDVEHGTINYNEPFLRRSHQDRH